MSRSESVVLGGERLVPYSPDKNLLKHKVILFPSAAEEYGTEADLLEGIRTFIYRNIEARGFRVLDDGEEIEL